MRGNGRGGCWQGSSAACFPLSPWGRGSAAWSQRQRFDYDYVLAILIAIITLIFIGEILSNVLRAVFLDNRTISQWFGADVSHSAISKRGLEE